MGELVSEKTLSGTLSTNNVLHAELQSVNTLRSRLTVPRTVYENNYANLRNKPAINEHELRAGDNTLEEIGIGKSSNTAINNLF